MEPLSITGTCVGLLSSIASLCIQITRFVGDVRDSRKDMLAVHRELSSLSFFVENLRDDTSGDNSPYPDSLKVNLMSVLINCNDVMVEIETLLEKSSSNSLGRRVLWAASTQQEMNKLRSRLEAHKATIEIALDMASIFLITTVKQDTSEILVDTQAIKQDTAHIPGIKEDTSELLAKISDLEARLSQTEQLHQGRAHILQRFLESSTTYAETVIQSSDSEESDMEERSISRLDEKVESSEAFEHVGKNQAVEALSENLQDQAAFRPLPTSMRLVQQSKDLEHSQNQPLDDEPEGIEDLGDRLEIPAVNPISLSHQITRKQPSFTDHDLLRPPENLAELPSWPPDHHSDHRSDTSSLDVGVDGHHGETTALLIDRLAIAGIDTANDKIDDKMNDKTGEKIDDRSECVVVRHYAAEGPDELTIGWGEVVVVLGQTRSRKWLYTRLLNNSQTGWVPSLYVTKTNLIAPKVDSSQTSLLSIDIDLVAALDRLIRTLDCSEILPSFRSSHFIDKLGFLIDKGANLDQGDGSLLWCAAWHFQVDILQYALRHCGAKGPGRPLEFLLTYSKSLRDFQKRDDKVYSKMIDLVIASGVDVDHLPSGKSSLELALHNDDWSTIFKLAQAGANNGLNPTLYGVVHACSESYKLQLVIQLVENGADINYGGIWKTPTIHVAIRAGQVDIVRYFIAQGADIFSVGVTGETALECATNSEINSKDSERSAHQEIVALLEEAVAEALRRQRAEREAILKSLKRKRRFWKR